ncbi:MAG: hypothetical protein ABSD31_18285 [Candidatus Binataceae bacterium]
MPTALSTNARMSAGLQEQIASAGIALPAYFTVAESRRDRSACLADGSGITETLTEKLWSSPWFEDVVYIEGRHDIVMTPERYLGAWRSVNDLRVQLGEKQFDAFLDFVEQRVGGQRLIEATYLTRAWSARRKE